jgi:hypothetical protein
MKNCICFSKLISARAARRSSSIAYPIAILLTLAAFASPTQSRPTDSLAGSVHGTISVISPFGQSYGAPGARIRLLASLRNTRLVMASYTGEYEFESVPPGNYQLEVTLDGFEKVARPITVHADEASIENVKLEVKGVRRNATVEAELIGLNLRDAGAATEIKQQVLRTVPLVNEYFQDVRPLFPRVVQGPSGLVNLRVGSGLTVNSIVAGYRVFNENPSRHFASAPKQTVDLPRFLPLKMQVFKRYGLRVSPRVSLGQNPGRRPKFPDVQGFYPRDFQGHLANANFGVFSNGVGRMFGMRFVIEKKSRVAESF